MVAVFREVWRVLHPSGVAWVNLGDSYAGGAGGRGDIGNIINGTQTRTVPVGKGRIRREIAPGLKPKDLMGIPWAVAFALRDDGWYLRDAITWAKAEVGDDDELEGSAMPGSQRDRCTTASEMIFMLTKSARYYFDPEGCKTSSGAMLRNVWRMNAENFKGAHYATFPRELPRRAILLGSSAKGCCPRCRAPWVRVVERGESHYRQLGWTGRHAKDFGRNDFMPGGGGNTRNKNGTTPSLRRASTKHIGWRPSCHCPDHEPRPCVVLDPFAGSGTSIVVAQALGRDAIGLDLSREYLTRDALRRITRPHAKPVRPARDEPLPLFDRESP
jgi:DNA modification methylase